MTITLLTAYDGRADAFRRVLDRCLSANLELESIERVVVLHIGDAPEVAHPKLECVRSSARPTYGHLFRHASSHAGALTCVVAPPGVAFDRSLDYLRRVDFSRTRLVIGADAGTDRLVNGVAFRASSELDSSVPLDSHEPGDALVRDLERSDYTVRDVGDEVATRSVDAVGARIKNVPRPRADAPKVWGIGLQRTGTASLRAAFNLLGLPTLELYGAWFLVEPDGDGLRFAPRVNHTFFQGYADSPVPLFFKEIDAAFPGSRFVLTTRPVDGWVSSVERLFEGKPFWDQTPEGELYNAFHRMSYGVDHAAPDALRRGYQRHVDDVLQYFADRPDDLLVMEGGGPENWEPLCAFLDKPVPPVPYPHENPRSMPLLKRVWKRLRGERMGPNIFAGESR